MGPNRQREWKAIWGFFLLAMVDFILFYFFFIILFFWPGSGHVRCRGRA